MNKVKATDRSRSIYNEYKAKNAGAIVTQSYLRLEKSLGTQQTVSFDVLNNVGTTAPNVTEKRLAITDNFLATEISIFIFKKLDANAINLSTLDTFPNALTYTGSGEATNLMNLYNGFLSVKINSVTYIESLDVYSFYRVGTAQQGVQVSQQSAGVGSNGAYLADQWDAGSWGFYPITPGIEFGGAKKNEITITTPASTAMGGTSSTNYVVCYVRGLLAQNAAQWQNTIAR